MKRGIGADLKVGDIFAHAEPKSGYFWIVTSLKHPQYEGREVWRWPPVIDTEARHTPLNSDVIILSESEAQMYFAGRGE